ncbi:MAG: amidohydrolase, partial [Synergistaceae bacterium]|nr:amidohydrolase [Synergistaceae bacterium]
MHKRRKIVLIIDAHVHVYPPEVIADWRRIAERESYFGALAGGRAHKWADAEDLLSAMDEDGVDESWICGFGFMDIGLCKLCNEYVIDAAARSGGRLKPLCVTPPLTRGACGEIERCAEMGAIGVGELFPDGQSWNIDDERETWRIAASCHENGLFLMIHVAEPVGREYPGKGKIGPREAYLLARNHPELKIVMAHWGGGLFLYERMRDVKVVLDNVWYDTAATPFLYDSSIFEEARVAGMTKKIIYGSDYPILRLPRFKRMFEAAGFGAPELDALMSGNSRRLTSELA